MARSGGRRGGANRKGRSPRPSTNRHYPRTARLNTLLQQIVADHLERVDDDRLGFLTVTGVEVDNDLNRAEVFVSALGVGVDGDADPEADEAYLEALSEYRKPIQAEIASQARLRKTPEVVFAFDPGVRAGARIEQILSDLDLPPDADGDSGDADGGPGDADRAGEG
jgi:ribosome-binding factor A